MRSFPVDSACLPSPCESSSRLRVAYLATGYVKVPNRRNLVAADSGSSMKGFSSALVSSVDESPTVFENHFGDRRSLAFKLHAPLWELRLSAGPNKHALIDQRLKLTSRSFLVRFRLRGSAILPQGTACRSACRALVTVKLSPFSSRRRCSLSRLLSSRTLTSVMVTTTIPQVTTTNPAKQNP